MPFVPTYVPTQTTKQSFKIPCYKKNFF